jgi:hypothetical protein
MVFEKTEDPRDRRRQGPDLPSKARKSYRYSRCPKGPFRLSLLKMREHLSYFRMIALLMTEMINDVLLSEQTAQDSKQGEPIHVD